MSKKSNIEEIQKQLTSKIGIPNVDYLNKLSETETTWLMMDIIASKENLTKHNKG
jgi:hypothetical protein